MRSLSLFVVLSLALAGTAAAEPVVLAVEGDSVYLDLGARDGVGAGSELELVRVVVATDPVSKRTLRDAFALGTLTVTRAGEHLSQATLEPALRGRVAVGDQVRPVDGPRVFADPWAERVLASKQAPRAPGQPAGPTVASGDPRASAAAAVAAADAASAAWRTTLGQPPRVRAEAWRAFLTANPRSPYAAAIETEIANLTTQADALDAAIAAANAARAGGQRPAIADALAAQVGQPEGAVYAVVPDRVAPERPIGVVLTRVAPVAGPVWLYVRTAGAPAYTRVAMADDGDAYLRATIPAEQVRGRAVEWYVTAGERALVGEADAPRSIAVERPVVEAPPAAGRTQVRTAVDYVDFDGGLEDGFDQYVQWEAEAAYRFLAKVHTARVGFGIMSGTGGPKDVIDEDPAQQCRDGSGAFRCRGVTFSYVYTEFEFRPRKHLAVMLRPQAGLLTTDVRPDGGPRRCGDTTDLDGCDFGKGYGLRARVRIGEELGTNLELAAGFTSDVGTLFEAMYRFTPTPKVPLKLAVQVTDLPVPEDFGVRLLADVGWRGVAWVYPSLRVSYQARDIDHVGFSGGLGLNFDW
jgi:hypothetical protein